MGIPALVETIVADMGMSQVRIEKAVGLHLSRADMPADRFHPVAVVIAILASHTSDSAACSQFESTQGMHHTTPAPLDIPEKWTK
jgi:hypothetical protein